MENRNEIVSGPVELSQLCEELEYFVFLAREKNQVLQEIDRKAGRCPSNDFFEKLAEFYLREKIQEMMEEIVKFLPKAIKIVEDKFSLKKQIQSFVEKKSYLIDIQMPLKEFSKSLAAENEKLSKEIEGLQLQKAVSPLDRLFNQPTVGAFADDLGFYDL